MSERVTTGDILTNSLIVAENIRNGDYTMALMTTARRRQLKVRLQAQTIADEVAKAVTAAMKGDPA